ncbi:hypothetical protein BO70DRAFT_52119 [Aspergillus heteromorphus CBS 117.55]|uniref:Uncharacterized protein n=1 Tax=Aspergillus heteromorphus CBS 117.55 TaxID=1448321 RepID=A0A317W217_9EURO|nr:uncharacterized protein BO70DRAFT_52119 [Aspergillus heteromorphus CBS 117.55]PWY79641.1 hypothetical protein BO70DRAFT_52119 [Aspergillus heteromorphus CBS 117.55]
MPGDEDSNKNRDSAATSDSRRWPDDENPFVAFRRYADEQVSSVLQSVMGIPSMSSRPSSGRWAVFEEDDTFRQKNHSETKGQDNAPGSGPGATDGSGDAPSPHSHSPNNMRQSHQWPEWQDPRPGRTLFDSDVDFFDIFFNRFWPDEYHHPSRFFQPYHNHHQHPMLSGPATHFPWPMGYILFNPYSPLILERQAQFQYHNDSGVFSSLMSSFSRSSECDPAEPQWREAFEDLIRLENGKPMLDRDPAVSASGKREHWGTWLSGLVNRGSLGDTWKSILSEPDTHPFPKIASEDHKHKGDDAKPLREDFISRNATEPPRNETDSGSMTEQELYDRFLDDISAREREFSRTVLDSPLLRLILQDTHRPRDTDTDIENWFERASGKHITPASDTSPKSEPQTGSSESSTEPAPEKHYVVSTFIKTERSRLPDGSIQTKTTRTKRFADGREESNESQDIVMPQHASHAQVASTGQGTSQEGPESDQKDGWFWKS